MKELSGEFKTLLKERDEITKKVSGFIKELGYDK